MRLLVADDHPLFRLGLKAALEAEGLEVVAEAGTGEEALAQALEKAPDAVLAKLETLKKAAPASAPKPDDKKGG